MRFVGIMWPPLGILFAETFMEVWDDSWAHKIQRVRFQKMTSFKFKGNSLSRLGLVDGHCKELHGDVWIEIGKLTNLLVLVRFVVSPFVWIESHPLSDY